MWRRLLLRLIAPILEERLASELWILSADTLSDMIRNSVRMTNGDHVIPPKRVRALYEEFSLPLEQLDPDKQERFKRIAHRMIKRIGE